MSREIDLIEQAAQVIHAANCEGSWEDCREFGGDCFHAAGKLADAGLLRNEITDAMVERARVAYITTHYWQVRRGVDADFSKPMRAALEAAFGVNH